MFLGLGTTRLPPRNPRSNALRDDRTAVQKERLAPDNLPLGELPIDHPVLPLDTLLLCGETLQCAGHEGAVRVPGGDGGFVARGCVGT